MADDDAVDAINMPPQYNISSSRSWVTRTSFARAGGGPSRLHTGIPAADAICTPRSKLEYRVCRPVFDFIPYFIFILYYVFTYFNIHSSARSLTLRVTHKVKIFILKRTALIRNLLIFDIYIYAIFRNSQFCEPPCARNRIYYFCLPTVVI